MKTLFMILFMILFVSVVFSMYYYTIYSFAKLFSYNNFKVIIISSFSLLSLLIFSSIIIKSFLNIFTRVIYIISNLILGIIFISFFIFIFYKIFSYFIAVPEIYSKYFILIIILLLTIISIYSGYSIKVKEIDIVFPVKKEIKLVHLSDVHIGAIHNGPYIKRIVDKTNNLNPNLIVITGDLFDGSAMPSEEAIRYLNNFNGPTFLSFGNHEYYEGEEKVNKALSKTRLVPLRNELVQFDSLQIFGADDPSFGKSLKEILPNAEFSDRMPVILLYHQPKDIEVAQEYKINLILSGHTHKGQIFPFSILAYFGNNRFLSGLYYLENTILYVSEGSGTWGPPLRIGSRNTITLIRLIPE
jgi:uncharacterized protein